LTPARWEASSQAQLLSRSGPIVPAAVSAGGVRVVAAVYDIGSGVVTLV
jgi:hypothetical protein